MHDIWNPWHGCKKCSEGCEHCYMYFLDKMRDQDGSRIYKTKTGFNYPLQKDKNGSYKIKSGEMIRVCMTSDFFLAEADEWRPEAWDMMRRRPDVIFYLLTKRPERIEKCLPPDWGEGYENVLLNVTCENQINIHPHSGWYFRFGHSPYTVSGAQVRFLRTCQSCVLYRLPVNGSLRSNRLN